VLGGVFAAVGADGRISPKDGFEFLALEEKADLGGEAIGRGHGGRGAEAEAEAEEGWAGLRKIKRKSLSTGSGFKKRKIINR
jgi:hypothetical protein